METLFIGQNLVQLDAVASTNTYAMELLKDVKVIEGTVITTDNQTGGKGQRGNVWLAEPSMNLTFSVVLYPVFLSSANHFYLSKITALALYDTLSELLPAGQHDIKIKWPNDIIVNDQKIAGILIENNLRAGEVQQTVIGIGLNVNQRDFTIPGKKVTSLRNLTGKELERKFILKLICKNLEVRYLQLKRKGTEQINSDYLGSQYLLNIPHAYTVKGNLFNARLSGVSNSGELELLMENGETKQFEVKGISF
jgi:BirA family biotin operon repressor/biotin-[acetyl-CoA-carboxylase] ligase